MKHSIHFKELVVKEIHVSRSRTLYGPIAVDSIKKIIFSVFNFNKRSFNMSQFKTLFEWMSMH